ncbi:MAG: transcription-repair coupling factor [Spirochaetota bacterium]
MVDEDLKKTVHNFREVYGLDGLASRILEGKPEFTGLPGSSKAIFTAALFQSINRSIVLVTRNNRDASDLFTDLGYFEDPESIHLFPSRETLPYDDSEPYREITIKRITALDNLLRRVKGIYVLPVRTFLDFYVPARAFSESIIELSKGKSITLDEIKERLICLGYEREERVSSMGYFSVRGDILDVYVCGAKNPHRVEFFDDVVESIREFSPLTQKSLVEVDSLRVIPAREVFLTSGSERHLVKVSSSENISIVDRILERKPFRGMENYLSLIYENPATVFDYAGSSCFFLFDSIVNCRKMAEFFYAEARRLYSDRRKEGFLLPPQQILSSFDSLLEKIGNYGSISLLTNPRNGLYDFRISQRKGYRGQIKLFKEDLVELLGEGYKIIVGAGYEGQTKRLRELLKDIISEDERLRVITLDLHEGFISKDMRIALILDREIFNRKRRPGARFLEVESRPIEGLLDIREGDFIVHVEHGIGIYRGIVRLDAGGTEKDFFKLEYRDRDEVFIPVDQINLLQRYIGYEGRKPRIDKIGTGIWKKVKEHVKKSVRDLAKELLELYSIRARLKGHSFSKDTEWQAEFESGFRYEETPDQLRTIEEIKMDMESPRPMDRLICGDVGFGKTEVAIRAAFKAVMDGKQVAVLVPTTILAEQHLNTFTERFSFYPINVEMLSRFKTRKEQRQIIQKLRKGLIDVIIGTHRLIQRDVHFKDLGLVIIDEEHRFGVEHKEKLKQLRKMVDVITMTATPIPRTLYMAMNRIRDMSIIETPPKERIPIETYVMEYNEDLIVQAIRREVDRGGQVYYVHNRVKTIDEKAEALRRLLPDITIQTAHGQMDEHELENIMKDFFDQQFQVLVTTTIIESGLDIPNVNTIVIERADRFGLSQLYQLRGRVGRSKRKAYAYLFYPPGRIITEKAEKRLSVINDHTELGAGFSIALKDLELRGAGNILGREQHGDMLAVGFEMYVKLLDEAIRELTGVEEEVEIEPVLDLRFRGYIPQSYVESEKLRIEIYKRLASIRKVDELLDLREEMIDRFGSIPGVCEELLRVVKLRIMCRDVGIKYIRELENELQITFEKSKVDIISLIQKIHQNRKHLSISPRDPNTLHVYRNLQTIEEKYEFLRRLFDYVESV